MREGGSVSGDIRSRQCEIGRFGMVVALGSEFSQPRNFGDSKIIKDGR